MTVTYNKLVRDEIPEIIKKSGLSCKTSTLEPEAYLDALDQKLQEETTEYLQSNSSEELADILEVVYAIAEARGCPKEQLEALRLKKRQARGGFEKRIFLIEADK